MTQILQSFYAIAPYLFSMVLIGAAFVGIWLITQLKKTADEENPISVADRMFLKRNATRIRKMEFH